MGWRARATAIPFAIVTIALVACNAITGAADLAVCDSCRDEAESDAEIIRDATIDRRYGEIPTGNDAGEASDASADADADLDGDAGMPLGCRGAVACDRVVFVTSLAYTGSLGGVAGADAKCQARADASQLARVKGHTFLAWISTAATSPADRFTHGTGRYYATGGGFGAGSELVAFGWDDLTDGDLITSIELDENGARRTGSAWTGTKSNGATPIGPTCADWTSSSFGVAGETGNVGGAGPGWSSDQAEVCAAAHNLYCFEL